MKATLRITNRTKFRSDHLRAFAVRAREQVFGSERQPLDVTFKPGRRYHKGRASIRGSWSVVWVPPTPDKQQLAMILVHEFAHNAGARGERWLRASTAFGLRTEGWRDSVAWALDLPLEETAAPAKPEPATLLDAKLASIETRAHAWTTKAKRAATALRKLARQRDYYQRKLAAIRGSR